MGLKEPVLVFVEKGSPSERFLKKNNQGNTYWALIKDGVRRVKRWDYICPGCAKIKEKEKVFYGFSTMGKSKGYCRDCKAEVHPAWYVRDEFCSPVFSLAQNNSDTDVEPVELERA